MTTTAAISGQSIGTSTNVGTDKFPAKVTCQSGSDRFFIEAILTNGAGGYDKAQEVLVFYASHTVSATADAAIVEKLRGCARQLAVKPREAGSAIQVKISDVEPLSGGYIYLWLEIPTVTVAQTITVNVVEGP